MRIYSKILYESLVKSSRRHVNGLLNKLLIINILKDFQRFSVLESFGLHLYYVFNNSILSVTLL